MVLKSNCDVVLPCLEASRLWWLTTILQTVYTYQLTLHCNRHTVCQCGPPSPYAIKLSRQSHAYTILSYSPGGKPGGIPGPINLCDAPICYYGIKIEVEVNAHLHNYVNLKEPNEWWDFELPE